jgi:hypothetical protein
MKITEKPQTVTLGTPVQCYSCGWKGLLGEAKQSIVIDHRPEYFIPSERGGNGKNYRCPHCKSLIFYVRYDNNRKIVAPSGHKFKDVI